MLECRALTVISCPISMTCMSANKADSSSFALTGPYACVSQWLATWTVLGVMKAWTLPFTAHSIRCRAALYASRLRVKSSRMSVSRKTLKAMSGLLIEQIFQIGICVDGGRFQLIDHIQDICMRE